MLCSPPQPYFSFQAARKHRGQGGRPDRRVHRQGRSRGGDQAAAEGAGGDGTPTKDRRKLAQVPPRRPVDQNESAKSGGSGQGHREGEERGLLQRLPQDRGRPEGQEGPSDEAVPELLGLSGQRVPAEAEGRKVV